MLGACLLLVGCGDLPRGAAVDREILRGADDPDADFAVYPVTRSFLPTLQAWPDPSASGLGWIRHSHTDQGMPIRPGDSVSLRVWDSTENSLLTATEQRSVDLTSIEVSPTGAIFVPYVGEIPLSGKTPDQARVHIQQSLEGIIPSAQVQLAVEQGRKSSVDLVGGVTSPGTYPVVDDHYTVLALLAAGGGVRPDLANPQIRLMRNGRLYGTSIDRLYSSPAKNTLLTGGDTVLVEEDDRYFLSMGSTGQEALHPFIKDDISALDALSIIGGVDDARGDPQGILVLREYPETMVGAGSGQPDKDRVVFTLDLTSSDGLFSAGRFDIQSGDLVMATESPVTNVRTVLTLIGLAVGSAAAFNN